MTAQPAYGWPQCEGKCINGLCALRWDHPACCAVRGTGDDYYGGHYSSDTESQLATGDTTALPATAAVPVWGGKWQYGAGDHGSDLYCWKH